MLIVRSTHRTDVALAADAPASGTAIAVLGFPFGDPGMTVQAGVLASDKGPRLGTANINVDVVPGDSGGPAIDASGRLVGIALGYRASGVAHLAIMADLETVRDFVRAFLPAGAAR